MEKAHRIVAALVLVLCGVIVVFGGASVQAASNSTFNQTINAGTLATDIMDASRVPVASPSVAMSAATFSFNCQTTTGTFGTNTERIYVTNPDAADNGWTLTMAATAGVTGLWSTGIDFNDGTGAGCTDGADADTRAGQLTIDPSVSTITTDCTSCTAGNITKGSSTAFAQGTTDSITLLNAAAGSDDIWRGYVTGIGLSQTIPAETAAGSYSINMTLTATAQ
ncbi:MAG TPA: hypothetical protein VFZ48_03100 [Candidatus Saccharimonadales bacterium]